MRARGRDRSLHRRRGLDELLGGGGRCGRGAGRREKRIVELGSVRGRGFLGRPGVSMRLGLGCRRHLGRGGSGIVGVGVDVEAGAGGMGVLYKGLGYVGACEGGSVVGTICLLLLGVVIEAVSSYRRIRANQLDRMGHMLF